MTTAGQFNTKSPTIKRILREAAELSSTTTTDYTAAPLETNLFEWHFTLKGPPSTPYARGIYHGRIVLPPSYPLRPPSFRFSTPSGRFEPNREICLSISGHHEESWQPAWGIRTALVAIRAFMEGDAKGQVGGVDASPALRERLASESRSWRCHGCRRTCEEIMVEKEQEIEREGNSGTAKQDEAVPAELRLGYRDQLVGKSGEKQSQSSPSTVTADTTSVKRAPSREPSAQTRSLPDASPISSPGTSVSQTVPITAPTTGMPVQHTRARSQQTLYRPRQQEENSGWLDMVIAGLMLALAYMIIRRLAAWM